MKKKNNFPDLTRSLEAAGQHKIQLNGQEVIFDKMVTLMPIALEPKIPNDEK
jgi:hypothetical protein